MADEKDKAPERKRASVWGTWNRDAPKPLVEDIPPELHDWYAITQDRIDTSE